MSRDLQLEDIRKLLDRIMDPEIPVISIVELGIIRNVELSDGEVLVEVTPTYSGCPAMEVIERDISGSLSAAGFSKVKVRKKYSPAWTSDWISQEGRRKLKEFGVAPPGKAHSNQDLISIGLSARSDLEDSMAVECPYCESDKTELRSAFGSTACKSLFYCRGCEQPFEAFKAI